MSGLENDAMPVPGPRRVVVAVFVVLGVVTGLFFYSMSAFVDSLADNGFSVSVASLAPTVTAMASGLGGLWVARLLRRFPVRPLMIVGVCAAGLSLAWAGSARGAVELCAAFAAFGLATAFTAAVPCTDLIARWFAPTPGRAMAIATTGMSIGGAVMPPIVVAVLGVFGLSTGALVLGVALVAVVALATAVIPEPARRRAAAATRASASAPRSGPMLLLMAGFALVLFSQSATIAHMLRIAGERGVDGAGILVILALASLGARLLGVVVIDAIGISRLALATYLLQGVGQAVFAVAGSLPTLALGGVLLGSSMGNTFVLMSLYTLAGFGLDRYAPAYAQLSIAATGGVALGPLFLGLAVGWFGGYAWPLLVLAGACVSGALLLRATRIDSRDATRPPSPEGPA